MNAGRWKTRRGKTWRVLEDLAEAGARALRRNGTHDERAIATAVEWVLAVAHALRAGLSIEGDRA